MRFEHCWHKKLLVNHKPKTVPKILLFCILTCTLVLVWLRLANCQFADSGAVDCEEEQAPVEANLMAFLALDIAHPLNFNGRLAVWWKPGENFFAMNRFEWLIVIALIVVIASSLIIIYRRRSIPTVPMSSEEREILQRAIDRILQCAMAQGHHDLAANLKRMRIGRVFTEEYAAEQDTNASTIVGTTTTHFAPSFFDRPRCQQYQTLIHEASRVGGNYVEDTASTRQAYDKLLADEEAVYRSLAACLGCCHDFPRYSPPPGCPGPQETNEESDLLA